MDGVEIDNFTIEQYLRLTQERQTPKKIEDMTIAEYLKYKKKDHISNTKSYLPTYFGKSTPTHDPIWEFTNYFNRPCAESDCDSIDMDEEVEYMIDDEGVENMNDALINIIKSIRQEMKGDIVKRQFEASTTSVSDEVSSIASNKVDKADDNTSNTAPCWLPKELSPKSFLLPFNINNHNFHATNTLDAKDNIMPQRVYEYLSLDKLKGTSTLENTTGTNEPLGTIDILVKFEELEFPCSEKIKFNIDSYQGIKKIYMVNIGQEEETFNPLKIGIGLFSYESHACLQFKQKTRYHGIPKPHDEIAGPDNLSPDRRGLVKRCHVCKTIHVTYDDGSGEDCGDPDSKFCFGYNEVFGVNEEGILRQWICYRDNKRRVVNGSYMGFADFLQVRYGQQKIDEVYQQTTRTKV
ncbi:hypothetical protein Tco_0675711 [Tanacetum coccineum]